MHFSKEIINWYHHNKRDLPWRNTRNPYKIWLSEIILQQTKVVQGLGYYLKFIKHFPTVQDLAQANEETVLKLWQGLGYYSRARNLHYSAIQIISEFNGNFPAEYASLIKLKGVGDYTASAVSSFCLNEPQAVVDGNVYRVLSRYFGIENAIDSTLGKRKFKTTANDVLDKKQPGLHNQAIMEFGALQCIPKSPECKNCPLVSSCSAYSNSTVNTLPRKQKKIKQRHRYFNYFIIRHGDDTYLEKRTGKGIWENLFQFPLIETAEKLVIDKLVQLSEWDTLFNNATYKIDTIHEEIKHVLSHQIIHARFFEIIIVGGFESDYLKVSLGDINKYPVPILIGNYIEQHISSVSV